MATVKMGQETREAPPGTVLSRLLGLEMPCGGGGRCGKCRVHAWGALSPPDGEERRHLTPDQLAQGLRLACRCLVEGDCTVRLPQRLAEHICTGGELPDFAQDPLFTRFGAAVDIGTTTLAARLYGTKGLLAQAAGPNPQGQYGADVIARVGYAMGGGGEELARCIRGSVAQLLRELSAEGGISPAEIDGLVIVGNTAMLYLLTGSPPHCLGQAPFEADRLFGQFLPAAELDLPCPAAQVYLPRCASAFVGADMTAALLASGICDQAQTALLADVGTNGELALWHGGLLRCCSTAAGPAFEGAGLSMGMTGRAGAVDRVWVENGALAAHVIGEGAPQGICGSGVIDALACLLGTGRLEESGLLEEDRAVIAGPVALTQQDVRMVQLAKSAICAGILTLIESAGLALEEMGDLAIAGGFGSFVDLENAGAIGLLPRELVKGCRVLGNAALTGAAMLLLNHSFLAKSQELAAGAETVDLSASAVFQERYVAGMFFEGEDGE